jgi:uncharacterized membrane protein
LSISPILNIVFPFYVAESFTELSILGSNHRAEDYPFNIELNQEERLFVVVSNHMGDSNYYRVYLKFRNQTQSSPSEDEPSLLNPLHEYYVFLLEGESWEWEVNFNFLEFQKNDDQVQVNRLMVDNLILELDSVSAWDSENEGCFFQLFFELWYYDVKLRHFNYYDQGFVGIWLKFNV